jgi:hypothetical protein
MAQQITNYDVILKVGDTSFPCHRSVLAEYSPYFQAMFGNDFVERDKTTIEIQARNLVVNNIVFYLWYLEDNSSIQKKLSGYVLH